MERRTARYERALTELGEHAQLMAFVGQGGFYAWQRLQALVGTLGSAYDAYELEGDVAPVRLAVEAYMADLHDHALRPEPGIAAYLNRFLADLEPATVAVTTQVTAAGLPEPSWPAGLLAIAPEELQALHEALQDRAKLP